MKAFTSSPEPVPGSGTAGAGRFHRLASFPVMLSALLFLAVFSASRVNLHDPDTWWHLAVGEQILASQSWPLEDTYSFTAGGTPWMAHEWLGEVLIAGFYRLGGLQGLALLVILLAGTVFALLYILCTLRSGNSKAAFFSCFLLLPLGLVFFTLRPQLMGYALLLLTLICLECFRQGRRRSIWALPLVFLLWVNTHGSFAFGLFVLGVYWLLGSLRFRTGGLVAEGWSPEQRRDLAVVFLLSIVALTLTPYGSRLAAYPVELAFFQPTNIGNVLEWQPLPSDLWVGKFFWVLLLGFFAALVLLRPAYRIQEYALAFFAIYAAATHRRFLFLFVLFFAPLLAVLLARWLTPYSARKDRPLLNLAVVAAVAMVMVAYFPSRPQLEEVLRRYYPHQAMEFLKDSDLSGPLLNEYRWGGYLIWAHSPEWKVFIDGRADIYEYSGVFRDYLRISRLAPDTPSLLRKHGIRACLLRPDAPLATYLGSQADWKRAFQDEVSVLYVSKNDRASDGHAGAAGSARELATAWQSTEHEIQQRQDPPVRKR